MLAAKKVKKKRVTNSAVLSYEQSFLGVSGLGLGIMSGPCRSNSEFSMANIIAPEVSWKRKECYIEEQVEVVFMSALFVHPIKKFSDHQLLQSSYWRPCINVLCSEKWKSMSRASSNPWWCSCEAQPENHEQDKLTSDSSPYSLISTLKSVLIICKGYHLIEHACEPKY